MTDVRPPPVATVEYWAVSVLSSRTMWLNAAALVVAVSSLSEVLTIIPPRVMPTYSAVVAVLNLILRFATVRPVALIPLGATKAVDVPRIGPPAPPLVTD